MKKKTSLVLISLSALLAIGGGTGLAIASGLADNLLATSEETNNYWNHYEAVAPTTTMHGSKEFWAHCSLHEFVLSHPGLSEDIREGVAFNSTSYFAELTSEDARYVAPLAADVENKSFPLQNAGYIGKSSNLDGYKNTFNDFTFAFSKNGSSYNPKSEKSNYVILYASNQITISSLYTIRKIEFKLAEGQTGYNANLISDVDGVVKDGDITRWTGASKSITFTAQDQYRFDNVEIYYINEEKPTISGEYTIKEILDFAKDYEYTPSIHGWYITENLVTVKIKAIDALDSVTTSGLDGGASGKVLCVDNTGYIICSSATKGTPPTLFENVRDYIKAGTTTYEVTGYLAFFNDVVEIKVDSYKYDKDLVIDYDLDDYVYDGVTDASSFLTHCKDIKQNKDGYGVGNIVKLSGVTYFNKYNSSGSYYFLDQSGALVPVYSLLDKDRASLIEGKAYDLIGVESLYNGRPSFRVLEVSNNTEVEPIGFDFSEAVEVNSTDDFYKINPYTSGYEDAYYSSATTIYKMDAYVSRYWINDKDHYTFNTSYYYDLSSEQYTTGSSPENAAYHKALGMFNESITYKQLFKDFILENASSEAECEGLKITLYFTLAYLDKVGGKYMWRVNIFEDLVFSKEYYESDKATIITNENDAAYWPQPANKYQQFSANGILVVNKALGDATFSCASGYLRINTGTYLSIEYSEPIMAFTLYHGTYSYISSVGSLDFKACRQFKDYTVILLNEPTTKVEIDEIEINGGKSANAYLRVDKIQINY